MEEPIESLRWWHGTVLAATMETPRARSLLLSVPGWVGHVCGQHIDVRHTTPSGFQAARSYSIVSPPEAGDRLEILVELVPGGDVSPYLVEQAQVGDELSLRGPLGLEFTWAAHQGGPLLLVAGGSGIAPMLAMLRHRALAGRAIPAQLIHSVHGAGDRIYAGQLAHLAREDDALDVIYTLTREQPAGWGGYRRRIDAAMLAEIARPPAERPRVYIAGATSFVEHIAGILLRLGYDPELLFTEWFSPG